MASAASTCGHNLNTKELYITDDSGPARLHVFVYGNEINHYIAIADGYGATNLCYGATLATTANTNTIYIVANGTQSDGGYWIDNSGAGGPLAPGATPESDGKSEIETTIYSNHMHPKLLVTGTSGPDVIQVGGPGVINVGSTPTPTSTSRTGPARSSSTASEAPTTCPGTATSTASTGAPRCRCASSAARTTTPWWAASPPTTASAEATTTTRFTASTSESDTVTGDDGYDTAVTDLKDKAGDYIEHRQIGDW